MAKSYDSEKKEFVNTENIFYSSPTVYDDDNMKYMFPNMQD